MKRTALLIVLLTLIAIGSASAAVEVTYTFNTPNVQVEAHDCLDADCNGVIGQSSLQFPDGKSTNNGKLRIIYPDSLATPFGYAVYYVADGYLPLESKATWHTFGVPGTATKSISHTFEKKAACAATVDNFAITNDVTANTPLVIRTSASLDATTHSAFSLTNNEIAPVPPQFKDVYYSVDTRVMLDIFDSNGNKVQSFPPVELSAANGNPLYASESRDVAFTWIPTVPGSYSAQISTEVIDDQCASSVPQSSSKPSFTVLQQAPTNRCDTLLNNLKVENSLPVHAGDDITVSYTKISNCADGNGQLSPVATRISRTVADANGALFVNQQETLPANADTGASTQQFTFTAHEGQNTIKVSGVADTGVQPNSEDIVTLNLNAEAPRLYDVEFVVSDDGGKPVVGAQVSMDGKIAATDADGRANIHDLAPGDYDARIEHPGHEPLTKQVQVIDFDRVIFVTLSGSNRPPVIQSLPSVTITKDANQQPVLDLDDYVIDDDDADSSLTWGGIASTNLLANVDPNTHVLDLTNLAGTTGRGNVQLTVTDPKGASASATLQVTITDQNTAPVIANLPDFTIQEDQHVHDALLLDDYTTDAETPSRELAYSIVANTNPEIGVSIDEQRRLDIQPGPDVFGSTTVTIQASDGQLSSQDSFTITVTPVNDAPLILDFGDVTTNLGLVTDIALSVLEVDPDDAPSALVWSASAADPSVVSMSLDQGAKTLTLTPLKLGATQITLTLTDAAGASDTTTFTYTVTDQPIDPTNPPGAKQCNDKIDNDGDGKIDYPADPGCSSLIDDDESDDSGAGAGDEEAQSRPHAVLTVDELRLPTPYLMHPGEPVSAYVHYENEGDIDLDNVKVTMSIDELGLYTSDGPEDLDKGERGASRLSLDLPSYVAPGYYWVRFSLHNDDIKRTVYREIQVWP